MLVFIQKRLACICGFGMLCIRTCRSLSVFWDVVHPNIHLPYHRSVFAWECTRNVGMLCIRTPPIPPPRSVFGFWFWRNRGLFLCVNAWASVSFNSFQFACSGFFLVVVICVLIVAFSFAGRVGCSSLCYYLICVLGVVFLFWVEVCVKTAGRRLWVEVSLVSVVFLLRKSWVFRNSFKWIVLNSMFSMEIFDLEDKVVKEKQVSEALSLLWAEFVDLEDIEAPS